MYEIFAELLKKHGLKTSDVAAATGISNMTFSDWKKVKVLLRLINYRRLQIFRSYT